MLVLSVPLNSDFSCAGKFWANQSACWRGYRNGSDLHGGVVTFVLVRILLELLDSRSQFSNRRDIKVFMVTRFCLTWSTILCATLALRCKRLGHSRVANKVNACNHKIDAFMFITSDFSSFSIK